MAWGKMTELKPESYFKPISRVKLTRALKIGVWGPAEAGKTHFCCTCPEPIYFIDTGEFGVEPVARKFDKHIESAEVLYISERTDMPDPVKCLENLDNAVMALRDVVKGTIAIDSITDVWGWMGAWMETIATRRSQKTGEPLQFEWQHANERYRNLVARLLAKRTVTLCFTAHPQPIYGKQGELLGGEKAHWMRKTSHWIDVSLHMDKVGIAPTEMELKANPFAKPSVKYISTIDKCRHERAWNYEIEDCTYDKLVAAMKEKLGIELAFEEPQTEVKT